MFLYVNSEHTRLQKSTLATFNSYVSINPEQFTSIN